MVIYDDIDLEPTKIRIRKKGSPGTHNGMKSVIGHLGTNNFPRVRVGIGSPIYKNDLIKYICYAVKSNYTAPAPEEIGKHYQWLPLNKLNPFGEGYYLVFQDAVDFKIIEL